MMFSRSVFTQYLYFNIKIQIIKAPILNLSDAVFYSFNFFKEVETENYY